MDGDGGLDLLGVDAPFYRVLWSENLDGLGTFGGEHLIADQLGDPTYGTAFDFEGDGDADVVVAYEPEDSVYWFENELGTGTFGPPQAISTCSPDASHVEPVDFDRDGTLEVVVSGRGNSSQVTWHRHPGTPGEWAQQLVSAQSGLLTLAVPEDFDGDGDRDLVRSEGSSFTDTGRLFLHRNLGFLPDRQAASATTLAITEVEPDPVPALVSSKLEHVTLRGTQLDQVGEVWVDGAPLDPAHDTWTSVSATELHLELPLLGAPGRDHGDREARLLPGLPGLRPAGRRRAQVARAVGG